MRIRPQITFDLGGIYDVGEVQIWNYNEAGATGTQPFRGRGVDDLTVLVSNDGISFTSLGATTLFAAPGAVNCDFHQTLDLDVLARFIRFANLTNHGGDSNFVGLSEVRFFGTVTPKPASIAIWSLFGLGLAGFGYNRIRRKK